MGHDVVEVRQRPVVLPQHRLDEVVRPVDPLAGQRTPQRLGVRPARHRHAVAGDGEAAPVEGQPLGVVLVQIAQQPWVRNQEPPRVGGHRQQTVIEQRGAPVREQTQPQQRAVAGARAQHGVVPDLRRQGQGHVEGRQLEHQRLAVVEPAIEIVDGQTGGAQRRPARPLVVAVVDAHDVRARRPAQAEAGRLDQILETAPRASVGGAGQAGVPVGGAHHPPRLHELGHRSRMAPHRAHGGRVGVGSGVEMAHQVQQQAGAVAAPRGEAGHVQDALGCARHRQRRHRRIARRLGADGTREHHDDQAAPQGGRPASTAACWRVHSSHLLGWRRTGRGPTG